MFLIASLVLLAPVTPLPVLAWNIPGHMLSGAIAYQVLLQENPPTIDRVKAVMEKHRQPMAREAWRCYFLLNVT